jgi:hypothetical protein
MRSPTLTGIRLAVEKNLASQNLRIALEESPPHAITEHRHLPVFFVFLLRERAPQQRCNSQCGKDLAAHPRRIHRHRIAHGGLALDDGLGGGAG